MSQKKISILLDKAINFMKVDRYPEAFLHLEKIIKLDKKHLAARMNMGVCHYMLHQYAQAATVFHHLHEENPHNKDINKYAGFAYMHLGNFETALKFLTRALKVSPDDVDLLNATANTLILLNRETDAIYFATQAISIQPKSSSNFNNLGSCFFNLNRFNEAVTCYQTALDLDPTNFTAMSNYANSLDKIYNYQASIDLYRKCLALPNLTEQEILEVKYKMSLPLLATGNLTEGWDCYEYGLLYKDRQSRKPQRKFEVPQWNGQNIQGKRLMVWREQGLGDELDFLALVPRLFDYCSDIVIESDTRLIDALKRSFPNCTVRSQSFNPHNLEQLEGCDFDYQIAMGSLPRFFLRDVSDFKVIQPYLQSDSTLVQDFKNKLRAMSPHPKVGICWRSGLNNSSRNVNYTPISMLEPILKLDNVTFVNLQYDDCREELAKTKDNFGVEVLNFEDIDLKNDLDSVAALISSLDGVVSAGTAVASLTGAIGTPLFLYKHRGWDNLGEHNSPWHPSARLYFSDATRSFEAAIHQIASDLPQALTP